MTWQMPVVWGAIIIRIRIIIVVGRGEGPVHTETRGSRLLTRRAGSQQASRRCFHQRAG